MSPLSLGGSSIVDLASRRLLLDAFPDAAIVVDAAGSIVALNDDAATMLGYEPEELIGRSVELLVPERLRAAHEQAREGFTERPVRRPMAANRVLVAHTKSGVEVEVLISLAPFESPTGERFVVASLRDISARRAAEDRYRILLEHANDGIVVLDQDGSILEINHRAARLGGISREEALGRKYLDFLAPEERQPSSERLGRVFSDGLAAGWSQEMQLADGARLALETSISRAELGGRQVALVIVRDFSDRRRAQETLASSERRFRALFERNPAGIFRTTPEGRLLECNTAFVRLLGFKSLEELQAAPVEELYFDRGERERFVAELRRSGAIENYEERLRRHDGSELRLLTTAALLAEPGIGEVIQGSIADITQLVEAREALIASERRYRQLYDNSPAGVFVATIKGTLVDCNASFAAIFGYDDPAQLRGSECHRLYLEPADRDRLTELLRARGVVSGLDVRGRRRDGTECSVVLSAKVGFSPELGEEVFEGTILDLTTAREAERQRAETDLRYRLLVESTEAIFWQADPETFQFTYVSPRAESLLGFPLARWLAEPDFWVAHLHPDDRERAVEFCSKSIAAGRDHSFEYRMVAADGRTVWIHDLVHVLVEAGRPVALAGFFIDATERRNLEAQLHQAQKMEAIGTLAGGVAHDFNNLMGVVLGYTEMMLAEKSPAHPDHERLTAIRQATDRAVALTRQLLAFSRRQVMQPRSLDLNALIVEFGSLLSRVLGDGIEVTMQLEPTLWPILADPN